MTKSFEEGAFRKALGRSLSKSGEACPDENVLSAYLEGGLAEQDRTALERHLAECMNCQQVLALSLNMEPDGESGKEPSVAPPRRSAWFRFSLPAGLTACAVALVAVGILFMRVINAPKPIPAEQTANLRAPAGTNPPPTTAEPTPPEPPASPPRQRTPVAPQGKAQVTGPKPETHAGDTKKDTASSVVAETGPSPQETDLSTQTVAVTGDLPSVSGGKARPAGTVGNTASEKSRVMEMRNIEASPPPPAASPTAASALHSFTLVEPRDAIRSAPSGAFAPAEKKIGERTFRWGSGYWIDAQCAAHTDEGWGEIKEGSPEFNSILKALPALAELRRSAPVLLYWNGKNVVIR